MEEIIIADKQKYLEEHYLFEDTPSLNDTKRCIHCDTVFTVGDFKIFKDKRGNKFICCPNAPNCDGTVIDWLEVE